MMTNQRSFSIQYPHDLSPKLSTDPLTLALAFRRPLARRFQSMQFNSITLPPISKSQEKSRLFQLDALNFKFFEDKLSFNLTQSQKMNKGNKEEIQNLAAQLLKTVSEHLSSFKEKEVTIKFIIWEGEKRLVKRFSYIKNKLIRFFVQNIVKIDQDYGQNEPVNTLLSKVLRWFSICTTKKLLIKVEEPDRMLSHFVSIARQQSNIYVDEKDFGLESDQKFKMDESESITELISSTREKAILAKLLQNLCFFELKYYLRYLNSKDPSLFYKKNKVERNSDTDLPRNSSSTSKEKRFETNNIPSMEITLEKVSLFQTIGSPSAKAIVSPLLGYGPIERLRANLALTTSRLKSKKKMIKEDPSPIDICMELYRDRKVRKVNFQELLTTLNPDIGDGSKAHLKKMGKHAKNKMPEIKIDDVKEKRAFLKTYMAN